MSPDTPRDPVTGMPAVRERPGKEPSRMSSREIEEEIRRTRAHMSAAVNEIEARISPERLRDELQDSVRGAVDGVRDQFHPQKMAKRAGDNMLETVKEHPIPALVAGLSIGYMVIKGNEHRFDGGSYRSGDGPFYEGYGTRSFRDEGYGTRGARGDVYPSRHPEYPAQYPSEGGGADTRRKVDELRTKAAGAAGRARGQASESIDQARERTGEAVDEARERAGEAFGEARQRTGDAWRDTQHRVQDQARQARRTVRHGARRAENTLERFVNDNPLMAGLLAAGVGAIVGTLLPSTDYENRTLGGARDELFDQAEDVADEARNRAQHVAEEAGEELQESAQRVAETAKTEAQQLSKETSPGEDVVATGTQERRQS